MICRCAADDALGKSDVVELSARRPAAEKKIARIQYATT